MLRSFILALLLTLVAFSQTKPEPTPQTFAQQVDQIFAKWDSTKSPGCAVEKLRQYAGLYWNREDAAVLRIVFRNEKLFADGIELLSLSDNRFQFIVDPTFTFAFSATPADPQRLRLTTEEPGDPPATLHKVQAFRPTATQLAEYARSYGSEEIDPVYRIEVQSAGLILNRPKSAPEKLTPLAEDYFQGLGGVMHFPRNQAGAVAGFVLDTDSTKHFRFQKQASR